ALGCGQIFLAGRFRRVFLFPFTAQYGHQVHSKSARASSAQELQRRIHRAVETLQRAARPTIHFPTRGARLDAAPTELLLAVDGATIKISLLRSMFPVLQNVQTPAP